jgi:pre-rRNA-processing protein TSR3
VRYEILVDRTESPNKCSILPLAYREDFRIVRFDRRYPIGALTGNLLLHPDGVPLDEWMREPGRGADAAVLSAVDCNWKRLTRILARIAGPLPPLVRIPDGFETAYLRRNKRNLDPDRGLATIEALFVAAAFLGKWDESLLKEFATGGEFLAINAEAWRRYGLGTSSACGAVLGDGVGA